MEREIFDVTIVGGGPVGLFAAFYCGMREMKVKVIEATEEIGGQLVMLYPDKPIYDIPGFPEIKAKDFIKNLYEQVKRFNPLIILGEKVEEFEKDGDIFVLKTHKLKRHYTKTIIISAGIGAFTPNKIDRPGINEFEGKGIYYFAKNFEEFKGKKVLIVGGGDSALDWALNIYPLAEKVTLIHRREEFRAHEASVKELFNSPCIVKLNYELKEVKGDSWVKKAIIFQNKTFEEEEIDVDAVILALGYKANIGKIEDWGFDMDGRYIKVNSRMETSIKGIFACGDIVSVEGLGNTKLLVTGFAQAAIAAGSAKAFIDPKAKIFGGHSSEILGKK
ncbi:MAG: NAD(P)/FAD-dependent oxidoreductase [candidate division WOR-3 bacterium]